MAKKNKICKDKWSIFCFTMHHKNIDNWNKTKKIATNLKNWDWKLIWIFNMPKLLFSIFFTFKNYVFSSSFKDNSSIRLVLFLSGLSILFSSHQFTFSWPFPILSIFLVLFLDLSNQVFLVFFRKGGGVILSWGLLSRFNVLVLVTLR